MKKAVFALLFHNYYGQHEYWLDRFFTAIPVPFFLFYNVVSDSIHNIDDDISITVKKYQEQRKRQDVKMTICASPDKGKDIGGKLVLMDSYLRQNVSADYLIFLHDKQSPQSVSGDSWSKTLMSIIDEAGLKQVQRIFDQEKATGIIAAKGFIRNEVSEFGGFISHNRKLLDQLIRQYSLNINRFEFVAGTMFAARSEPVVEFFKQFSPLGIRSTLETGNVSDDFSATYTHSWERMLSWIVKAKGYSLKGI